MDDHTPPGYATQGSAADGTGNAAPAPAGSDGRRRTTTRRNGSRRARSGADTESVHGGDTERKSAERPADPEARAREICLRMLTRQPRTRAQLAEALRRNDIPEETAEAVLGRFGEVGLVDDAAFASAWVESRHAGRGLARPALAEELRRRGVANETVAEAVSELDRDSEEEMARRLVRRKLAATRGRDDTVRIRRLMGMLARKGYSRGLAYRVAREELAAEGVEAELPDPDID